MVWPYLNINTECPKSLVQYFHGMLTRLLKSTSAFFYILLSESEILGYLINSISKYVYIYKYIAVIKNVQINCI